MYERRTLYTQENKTVKQHMECLVFIAQIMKTLNPNLQTW